MAGREFRDKMVTCTRCGVVFLWPVEEQRQAVTLAQGEDAPAEPELCPGCRRLAPAPGRERGLVKWYSSRKRYGFIVRADASELFAHRTQLTGIGRLQEGDLVEFGVQEGDKGAMAIQVHLLERQQPPKVDNQDEEE
jgi:cold shock protein